MLIDEFNSKFTSKQEKSRLFGVLRRLSLLDTRVLLASTELGWPEWPPIEGSGSRLLKA